MSQDLEITNASRGLARYRDLVPPLVAAAGDRASRRAVEFFTADLRNPHTRRAYARAVSEFLDHCQGLGLGELAVIEPVHVAAWIERLGADRAPSTVKQRLAAVRRFFDYLVAGGALASNPAAPVRGPRLTTVEGKTPVLLEDDARRFLESIDTSHLVGLRDRALVAVMLYSFARVSAVVQMDVRDVLRRQDGALFRLHEKGGKARTLPAHSKATAYLDAYLDAAGELEPAAPLFQSTRGRSRRLTGRRLHATSVLAMVKRRARDAGFSGDLTCHTWRATGITDYLAKGGRLEIAAAIAGHSSTQTTRLYDRRSDLLNREEIERIRI